MCKLCFAKVFGIRQALRGTSAFLFVAILFGFALCGLSGTAGASTGILALDSPALTVKAVDRVYLDAVVRAGTRLVAAGEHGVIIYSDDNGVSWTQAAVPVDATLTALAFASPQIGWAVGNYGVILGTKDGGKSWYLQLNGIQAAQLTLAAAQQAEAQGSHAIAAPNALRRANIFVQQGPDKPFLSVISINAEQALVFGAFRLAMRTDDGGKTWQDWSLHIDDPISQHLYDAAIVGPDIYLAGEAGDVFRAGADAAEFSKLPNAGMGTLFGVIGTGDGVLVYGVGGQAYKSVDHGASWQPVSVGLESNLTAAMALQSGALLLAAQPGKLLISQDHGTSFQISPVSLPMSLAGLAQAADGTIIVVGNRGVIRLPLSSIVAE